MVTRHARSKYKIFPCLFSNLSRHLISEMGGPVLAYAALDELKRRRLEVGWFDRGDRLTFNPCRNKSLYS